MNDKLNGIQYEGWGMLKLLKWVMIICAVVTMICGVSIAQSQGDEEAQQAVKWLFLVHDSSGVIAARDEALTLTVPIHSSQVVAFTDGPIRIVKTMDLSEVAKAWKDRGGVSLGNPTSVLSVGDKNGVIVIRGLEVNENSAIFEFKMGDLHKDIFREGDSGAMAMVIDSYTPCVESCGGTGYCKDICVFKALS